MAYINILSQYIYKTNANTIDNLIPVCKFPEDFPVFFNSKIAGSFLQTAVLVDLKFI